jgi:octaprenyl-diphosphate synthase
MKLEDVYRPIAPEIDAVKLALKDLIPTFDHPSTVEVVDRFSRIPGKLLRPALLLLSAKAVAERPAGDALIRAAVAVELIHDASLVHDDILDNDTQRRGQPTVNALWGTKVAVLTGDVLYSRAYGQLTGTVPVDLLRQVVRLSESMCSAEIEQARTGNQNLNREQYFRIIEGKTAAFMSLSCRLGASLAGADEGRVEKLAAFGLAFGLAYQLFDDRQDGDLGCSEVDGAAEGLNHARLALEALNGLAPTAAGDRLKDLVGYLLRVNGQTPLVLSV